MTPTLHRRLRRNRQRGAAVFMVTLAIVLLTGLGLWAMQWAAMVDQASGYSRAARQTQFVAELGLVAGTSFLSVPGWGATQYRYAITKPDTCDSTRRQVTNRFCRSMYIKDINDATQADSSKDLLDPGTVSAVGSLGGYLSGQGGLQGRFFLEMTDPQRAIVAGSDISKSQYFRVTLTSRSEVLPSPSASTAMCSTDTNSVASRSGMRAHTILGPI